MKNDAAKIAYIRQLCCMGLGSRVVMPRLLQAVRSLVASDSAGFFWIDVRGEMRNFYAERTLSPQATVEFWRHYDDGDAPFRRSFLARASAAEPISTVSVNKTLERTSYYQNVLRELEADHVLHAIVRDPVNGFGQLSLYRSRSARPFSPADRQAIKGVLHYIAHAIASHDRPGSGATERPQFVDSNIEALLIVRGDGDIEHASGAGRHLLLMAAGDNVNPSTIAGGTAGARTLLERLHREVVAVYRGRETAPPRRFIENAWGRFAVRSYALSDNPLARDARFAVHITRQEPALLKLAEAVRCFPLSPQQAEVALLLARGLSNTDIAERMSVSLNTASYHVKQLFMKLDVHSRQEAIQRLSEAQPARPEGRDRSLSRSAGAVMVSSKSE
ncbi:MAG TPA: helix-turn-helix transcriptional regulator [Burkholderiales bacterium]